MSRTSLGVLGFVCLLVAGQGFAGDDKLAEKLLIRATENVARATTFGTISFENGEPEDIYSFSWGVTQSAAAPGSGGGAGKATMQPFSFVKKLSKSSSAMFLQCVRGEHIKEVVIVARNSKGQKYMEIKFTDVIITSYQLGGGSSEEDLLDSISIEAQNVHYILIGL
jgi:type VI protein secretion system component Hcp